MPEEITLLDDEVLQNSENCEHNFSLQANVDVKGIIYDIYFCNKCLLHVKKERPCPYNLKDMN